MSADYPALPTAASIRADYIAGRIEADEYEARLDTLLAQDPDALDRKPKPGPSRNAQLQGAYGQYLPGTAARKAVLAAAKTHQQSYGLSPAQAKALIRRAARASDSAAPPH